MDTQFELPQQKKKYKIIIIMNHPPYYEAEKNIKGLKATWETQNDEIIGTSGQDWPDLIASSILTQTNEFEFEVWQPDYRADMTYSYQVSNNLVHRLFPATDTRKFYGIRINRFITSPQMINALLKLKEQKIIIHLNAAFRYINLPILKHIKGVFPIVGQFYTNNSSLFSKAGTLNPIQYIHRKRIKQQLLEYYKYIEHIVPSVETGTENFEKTVQCQIHPKSVNICGEDLKKWSPNYSKTQSRKVLGIADSEFILFSSSRLIDIKQIDLLIAELSKINHLDFKYYISGRGNEQYEAYLENKIKELDLSNKIKIIGYVDIDTLKTYFEACDVVISTSRMDAGSQSVIHGLCLKKPIISTNIGTTYEFLRRNNSGLIIDRLNSSHWFLQLEHVITGKIKIPIVDYRNVEEYLSTKYVSKYYIDVYKKIYSNFYN